MQLVVADFVGGRWKSCHLLLPNACCDYIDLDSIDTGSIPVPSAYGGGKALENVTTFLVGIFSHKYYKFNFP